MTADSAARMDLTLSPEHERLRAGVRHFIESEVIPLEDDPESFDDHENIRLELLDELREKARGVGPWAPQVPPEFGGAGLPTVARAALYEEMGRSIFGPECINCAAPDDGNMMVLAKIATPAQRERWLLPRVRGDVRSSIVMTEPGQRRKRSFEL